jgi:hypothetical protein
LISSFRLSRNEPGQHDGDHAEPAEHQRALDEIGGQRVGEIPGRGEDHGDRHHDEGAEHDDAAQAGKRENPEHGRKVHKMCNSVKSGEDADEMENAADGERGHAEGS